MPTSRRVKNRKPPKLKILPKPALTKQQVGNLLGLGSATIENYIRQGHLRAIRFNSCTTRILPEDLDRFLVERATIKREEDVSA